MRWQVQEAKQRFAEVLKAAESEPQIVTDHGEEIAVVIDIEVYRRLIDGRVGLMEYLRAGAVAHSDDFAGDRPGDLTRETDRRRVAGRAGSGYTDRILPVTAEVADQWGRLNAAPAPPSVVSGLMAATAMVHHLTLVTGTVSGMGKLGVHVVNPFAR